jgi:FSR family fosmidomycin resistance protein-like MFS transporter
MPGPADPNSSPAPGARDTVLKVLLALSFSHLLNDLIQALLPTVYPLLKQAYQLSFAQIGLITLCFQLTSSLLQPLVGLYTDRRPQPFSLAIGMGCTLVGLALLSHAGSYHHILEAAALVGVGSAVFHPEASRIAKLASGGRHGFAQSLFQVGGNFGSGLGPLLAALIIVPHGQGEILWFTLAALLGIVVLARVGRWYRQHVPALRARAREGARAIHPDFSHGQVVWYVFVLLVLILSKYLYLVSLSNYYTFYLHAKFGLPITSAHIYLCLCVFLFAVAAGTIIGGPIGDRFGRKYVIWVSILGVAPFTLWLPHAGLAGTVALSIVIGLILASAFSAILVYAQELIPGRTGLVAGLFFGFAFGVAGVGAALLGKLADHTSIFFVFQVCAYLPLLGLFAGFLPRLDRANGRNSPAK